MSGVPLSLPRHRGEHPWQPWSLPTALWAIATVSAVLAVELQRRIFTSEPVFSAINVAVMTTLVTLGTYLVVRQDERFTGLAFAVAGVAWSLSAFDSAFPTWGPYVEWVFAGTVYVLLGAGVLKYRRAHRSGECRRFVLVGLSAFVGLGAVSALFIPPRMLGYSAHTFWPVLLTDGSGARIATSLDGVGFIAVGVYFVILMIRVVRTAPYISKTFLRPMAIFGAILAVGAAAAQSAANLGPSVVKEHDAVSVVGLLVLGFSGALAVSLVRQRTAGTRLVARLPPIRTPATVAAYVKDILGDPSAELWYWSPDIHALVDDHGLRRPCNALPGPSERFSMWIPGSDGSPVALLTADPTLAGDLSALEALTQVLSIIAENARLNVLVHMKLAELTATRTAEQLAFTKAQEEFHRNLHDGLQQTIATVRMDLDGLGDLTLDEEAHATVAALEAKLDFALDQVHSLKKGATPPELRFGLKPAIDRALAQLRLLATCQVSEEDLGILALPVYYVVREALTNVYKHARANHVEVDVSTSPRAIVITVSDDGGGGATSSDEGGLNGMRRRVTELGGAIEINSSPGVGTVVTATLPRVG